jgi:hypothetical protein
MEDGIEQYSSFLLRKIYENKIQIREPDKKNIQKTPNKHLLVERIQTEPPH